MSVAGDDRFDAVEVLTRSGAARDALFERLQVDGGELDALLVSDMLRIAGRVGATLATRRAVVELCALLRAIDAAEDGRIELDELRAGLAVHKARTDGFAGFHGAGVLLRTLAEVLDHGAHGSPAGAVRSQLAWLHRDLRQWLLEQLTGQGSDTPAAHVPPPAPLPDARDPYRVREHDRRRRFHGLVDELMEGPEGHPVTGLPGSAWIRGWSAVPVAGEMLGDDPDELSRLGAALELVAAPGELLVQVDRRPAAPWQLEGDSIVLRTPLRASWELPASPRGIALAATVRPGWCVLTTPSVAFAYVEGGGHHAVLGPPEFVEATCGRSPLEAVAAFREHVEELAVEGEPPPDLLDVAERFGRLRRRSR